MEPIQTSLGGWKGGDFLLKVINHIWGAALYITVVRNFRFGGDGGNGKLFSFFLSLSPVGVGNSFDFSPNLCFSTLNESKRNRRETDKPIYNTIRRVGWAGVCDSGFKSN